MTGMKIQNVSNLIARCWNSAEAALRESIEAKFPDKDEEFITELFQGELGSILDAASSKGEVAHAFQMDLEDAFPGAMHSDLSRISYGLIATVNFHSKSVEKKTGGDFGLVFIRPDVSHAWFDGSDLMIDADYQRGLLCQAKVLRRDAKWGDLTQSQKKVLSNRLGHLGLVLYQYVDGSDRRKLSKFHWQLTAGVSIEAVSEWLKTGEFPNLQRSFEIIISLAQDRIGTDDKEIIAELIAPPTRPSLEIRVHWRDGDGPGPTVRTHVATHGGQHVRVQI